MKKRLSSIFMALMMVCSLMMYVPDMSIRASAKSITVFSQTDRRWADHQYGYSNTAGTTPATINSGGCGILAYVNAVYYLNGNFIEPTYLADWSVDHGYRVNGKGTSLSLYKAFANSCGDSYDFEYNGSSSSYSTLREHLQAGEVAIGSAPDHLMAVVDYDSSSGKFLILDSYRSSNRLTYPDWYTWQTENTCRNTAKLQFSSFYFLKSNGTIPPEDVDDHVDVGTDFYAYIINTEIWMHLTNDGCNVSSRKETGESNQIWYFERQDDGSYKITNAADNRVLDDHNFEQHNGANVEVCGSNDSDAQRWFISGESADYSFRAKCGDAVIDVSNCSTEEGTNVQMWKYSSSDKAQKFQIWKLTPSASYIHVSEGTKYEPTVFWWNETSNTKSYALKIWKDELWEGDAYKIVWGLTDNECRVDLPVGHYVAYVDSRNGDYGQTMSENVVEFDVVEGDPIDYGDDFKAMILNYDRKTDKWKPIMQNDDGEIVLSTESRENYNGTLWHFIKNEDGSYHIWSYKNGQVLKVQGRSDESGAKVHCHEGDSLSWEIMERADWSVSLYPQYSDTRVLDVDGGVTDDGTPVQIWTLNDSNAQKFKIYKIGNESKLDYSIFAEEENVTPGTQVKISVEGNTPYVYNYKFHIKEPDGNEYVVDNKCQYIYTFEPKKTGKYIIWAEIKNPNYTETGSETNKSVTIEVGSESLKNPTFTYEKGNNAVKLTWNKVNGAEKYGIAGYVGGKWKLLDIGSATASSYVLKNLKAGTNYKIAIVAMFDGKWNMDFANAIVVTPNAAAEPQYPDIIYAVKGSQFRLNWTAVPNAQAYAVAVYQNGWKLLKNCSPDTLTYTSAKLTSGTYHIAVAAKINGKWDTTDIKSRAVTITIK